jgi:hypothetical protein
VAASLLAVAVNASRLKPPAFSSVTSRSRAAAGKYSVISELQVFS